MKQTLQLKLTQHLTLTPQLQQSIRLLQLSTLELNAEVERILQENPLLEKAEGDEEGAPPAEAPPVDPRAPSEAETRTVPADAGDGAAEDGGTRDTEERRDAEGQRDTVDRADFEDYSSGDSDWGGRQRRRRRRRVLSAAGRDAARCTTI